MIISQKKLEGIFMLMMAALCFWLPHHLKQPGLAHHRILVATEKLNGGFFDHAVVLVVQQNGIAAQGFVLNKMPPKPSDPAIGGPVAKDEYYTIHSVDSWTKDTATLQDLQISYTAGEGFAKGIGTTQKKPDDYIIFKGCAVWGLEQLSHEIENGAWTVIDFDRDIIFHTPPAKMYEAAVKHHAVN